MLLMVRAIEKNYRFARLRLAVRLVEDSDLDPVVKSADQLLRVICVVNDESRSLVMEESLGNVRRKTETRKRARVAEREHGSISGEITGTRQQLCDIVLRSSNQLSSSQGARRKSGFFLPVCSESESSRLTLFIPNTYRVSPTQLDITKEAHADLLLPLSSLSSSSRFPTRFHLH